MNVRRVALVIGWALGAALAALRPAALAAAEPMAGADLSHLPRLLAAGAGYHVDGAPVDPLAALHDAGFRMARLRLWHSPGTPWSGLDSTLAFAVRLRQAGFEWMLDIHYSDTWADPGHQTPPAAWWGLAHRELADSVYAYTRGVIARCREAGAPPQVVQLGNEVGSGLLGDAGRVGWPGGPWDTPAQWSRLTDLLRAAVRGVRDGAAPEDPPAILLHLADGGDNARCRWFLDHAAAAGVPFDAVGVSFYPWWHGSLGALDANLRDLAGRYGRDVWVVETAYPWTLRGADAIGNFVTVEGQLHPGYAASPEGQLAFLRDLLAVVREVPQARGRGVLCWEPAFIPCADGPPNPVENLALFDFGGGALPGLGFAAPRGRPGR